MVCGLDAEELFERWCDVKGKKDWEGKNGFIVGVRQHLLSHEGLPVVTVWFG